ncbi:MAG: hypothetical protein AAGL10_06790 [Pseudomonadota bacterium]
MKAYGIFPLVEASSQDEPVFGDCQAMVTSLVCECLRAGGDRFHVAVDWRDPDGEEWGICTEGIAQPAIVHLGSEEALRELVHLSTDPLAHQGAAVIRSMATCRAATFGWDGQAFLCLRNEDDPPISPDAKLIEVRESPELLIDCDYFDGVIVSP